jgi:AcrR family transcriptional regulator
VKTVSVQKVLSLDPLGDEPSDPLRDRVVDAARELFFRSGFSRITMADLASRLGIGKATLYTVFDGKDAIVLAVIRRTVGEAVGRIETSMAEGKSSFVERVTALLRSVGGLFASISPVFIDDLRRGAPRIWAAIDAFRHEKLQANFTRLLRGGIEAGAFRADLDIDLVLDMFIGLIERYINPEAILRHGRSASDLFEAIIRVFFQGLLTERGRSELSGRLDLRIPPAKDYRP